MASKNKEYVGVSISKSIMDKIRKVMAKENRNKSNAIETVLEKGLNK